MIGGQQTGCGSLKYVHKFSFKPFKRGTSIHFSLSIVDVLNDFEK